MDVFISEANHEEKRQGNDFSWSGVLEERLGTVTLIFEDGELFGHISVDDKKFELYPLGEDVYALAELNVELLDSEECAAPTESPVFKKMIMINQV